MKNLKYILYVVCGLLAFAPALTSCQDNPEEIPAEETFLREFIKKYGLIDPNQDWNQAERTSVKVVVDHADEITVYTKYFDKYYRVACFADVDGEVSIPLDVPEATDCLYVQVDGKFIETTLGGTVNLTASSRASESRAEVDYSNELRDNQHWWNDQLGADGTLNVYHVSEDIPTPDGEYIKLTSIYDQPKFWENNVYTGGVVSTENFESEGSSYTAIDGSNNQCFAMSQGAHAVLGIHNAYKLGDPAVDAAASFVLEFDTQVSTNSKLYIKLKDQYRQDYYVNATLNLSPGSSQHHEIIINNLAAGAWLQIGFYVPQGNITSIGNFRFSVFSALDMGWLMVAEDLGATDDFDFNDVIIRVEELKANEASLKVLTHQWQVIKDDDEHIVLNKKTSAPAKSSSRAGETYSILKLTPMSAGGILDSYLHFHNGTTDYVLKRLDNAGSKPWNLTGSALDASIAADASGLVVGAITESDLSSEWHSWFSGDNGVEANQREMLNTGYGIPLNGSGTEIDRTGYTSEIIVSGDFSLTNYSQIFKDYDGDTDNLGTNTGSGSNTQFGYQTDVTSQIEDWQYDANDRIHGFYISVGHFDPTKADYKLGQPKKGRAPQMFLIPDVADTQNGLWRWPHERVDIIDVYPQFKGWVNNNINPQWYMQEPTAQAQTKEGKKAGDYEWVKAYIDR